MKRAYSLAILVLVSSAAAQTVQSSVCEVTQSPASFDNKIVRLRATVVSGFEAFGIRDPGDKCGTICLTYGVWATLNYVGSFWNFLGGRVPHPWYLVFQGCVF